MNDKIRVFRPAFIASLVGFAWGFWQAVLPGIDPGAGYVAGRVFVGIVFSVMAFVVVIVWQGARRYLTRPTSGQALTKSKPDIATALTPSETLQNKEHQEQVSIKSDIAPQESAEDVQQISPPSLLATCLSCGHNFSKRAPICPKCSTSRVDRLAECLICKKQIPANSTNCPECGDPKPFGCEEQILATAIVNKAPCPDGRVLSIFKTTLKVLGILFLLFLLARGLFWAYDYYEDKKREEEELSFNNSFTSLKWAWHNRDNFLHDQGVQIHTPEGGGGSILRKVDLEKKSAIYAYKNDDYSITTMATFTAECQPEKVIVTSKTFSDGEPKKLVCNKDGNQLSISVSWSRKDNDFSWREDLDGFFINESFSRWDFSKLEQEVTLSKQSANPKVSTTTPAENGRASTNQDKEQVLTSNDWQGPVSEFTKNEDWTGLIIHALSWTKSQPGDAFAWTVLGLAYGRNKQTDKAIEAYQQATRIEPENGVAWNLLGVAYGRNKQTDKAIESWQQALRIEPKDAEVWNNLGRVYLVSNQHNKAIEAYQQAVLIDPKHSETWNHLGEAYANTKQTDKAIEAYQQAVRINPEYAEVWNLLGIAYQDSKQTDKAIEAFQQAVRINPEDADAWCNLGVAYHLKLPAKAIEGYQQAVRINPEYADAWNLLGFAYQDSKQSSKAIEAFQQVIRINPEDADAWHSLGVVYKHTAQTSQVMEVHKHLKTLNLDKADEFYNEIVMPQ